VVNVAGWAPAEEVSVDEVLVELALVDPRLGCVMVSFALAIAGVDDELESRLAKLNHLAVGCNLPFHASVFV
jgi:hypothetical protein